MLSKCHMAFLKGNLLEQGPRGGEYIIITPKSKKKKKYKMYCKLSQNIKNKLVKKVLNGYRP